MAQEDVQNKEVIKSTVDEFRKLKQLVSDLTKTGILPEASFKDLSKQLENASESLKNVKELTDEQSKTLEESHKKFRRSYTEEIRSREKALRMLAEEMRTQSVFGTLMGKIAGEEHERKNVLFRDYDRASNLIQGMNRGFGGLLTALGVTTGAFFFLGEVLDARLQEYRELNKVGVGFSGSVIEMSRSAANSAMNMQEMNEMIKGASSSVRVLVGRDLPQYSDKLRQSLYDVGQLGMTMGELNKYMADYFEVEILRGEFDKMNAQQRQSRMQNFVRDLDRFTNATGIARENLLETFKNMAKDPVFGTAMSNIAKDVRDRVQLTVSSLEGVSSNIGGVFQQMTKNIGIHGTAVFDETTALFNNFSGGLAETFEQLATGQIGTAEFFGALRNAKSTIEDNLLPLQALAKEGNAAAQALLAVYQHEETFAAMEERSRQNTEKQVSGLTALMNNISDTGSRLAAIFNQVANILAQLFEPALNSLASLFQTITSGVLIPFGEVLEKASNFIADLPDTIKTALAGAAGVLSLLFVKKLGPVLDGLRGKGIGIVGRGSKSILLKINNRLGTGITIGSFTANALRQMLGVESSDNNTAVVGTGGGKGKKRGRFGIGTKGILGSVFAGVGNILAFQFTSEVTNAAADSIRENLGPNVGAVADATLGIGLLYIQQLLFENFGKIFGILGNFGKSLMSVAGMGTVLRGAFGVVATAITGVTWPVVAAIAAVSAVAYTLYDNWTAISNGLANWVSTVWENLKSFNITGLLQNLTVNVLDGVSTFVGMLFGSILELFGLDNAGKVVREAFANFTENLTNIGAWVVDKITSFLHYLNPFNWFDDIDTDLIEHAKSFVGDMFYSIKDSVSEVFSSIGSVWDWLTGDDEENEEKRKALKEIEERHRRPSPENSRATFSRNVEEINRVSALESRNEITTNTINSKDIAEKRRLETELIETLNKNFEKLFNLIEDQTNVIGGTGAQSIRELQRVARNSRER